MLKKNEFKRVYDNAKALSAQAVVILCLNNGTAQNRLGIVASKKVGNSVVRNKARRRIKEIYRVNEDNLSKGYDIVIIARSTIKKTSFTDLESAIKNCFIKFKIFEKNYIK
jgi:ribonuclease P protein component